jgi:hypothetical protein
MELHDVNKLPPKEWILRFPISMARISNAQDANKCFEYIDHINPEKISAPKVGVNFCYCDFLYLYSEERAVDLKKKFSQLIVNHQNACKNVIKKPHFIEWNRKKPVFFIEKAFAFDVRNTLYLDYNGNIFTTLMKLKKIYQEDKLFQKYVREDLAYWGRKELTENQLMFFLEEHLIAYLITKWAIRLHNEYIPSYKRALICYPWPMLKQHIYLLQKNFFKLENKQNKYENCRYNLEWKKLYDAMKIDLEKYNYES